MNSASCCGRALFCLFFFFFLSLPWRLLPGVVQELSLGISMFHGWPLLAVYDLALVRCGSHMHIPWQLPGPVGMEGWNNEFHALAVASCFPWAYNIWFTRVFVLFWSGWPFRNYALLPKVMSKASCIKDAEKTSFEGFLLGGITMSGPWRYF